MKNAAEKVAFRCHENGCLKHNNTGKKMTAAFMLKKNVFIKIAQEKLSIKPIVKFCCIQRCYI
jgi:hypothetical protein